MFALSASLVLSLTVVPVLASFLLKRGDAHEPRLVRKLTPATRCCSLRPRPRRLMADRQPGRWWPAGGAYLVGKTFMPTMDEGDIIMQPRSCLHQPRPDGATDLRVQQAVMQQVPEVKAIVARSGSDELGLDPMGLNQTDTFLVLKPRDEWREPDKTGSPTSCGAVMENFPGIALTFTQPIDMRVSEMLTGVRGDLAIKLYGPDLPTLNHLASQIRGGGEGRARRRKTPSPSATRACTTSKYIGGSPRRRPFGLNVEDVQGACAA